jgi:hypothetical protein
VQLGGSNVITSGSQAGIHVFYIDWTTAAPVSGQWQMFNVATIGNNSGQIYWNQTVNDCCHGVDSVGIFGSVDIIAAVAAVNTPIFYLQTFGAGLINPATGCTPAVSCSPSIVWSVDIAGRTTIDTSWAINGEDKALFVRGGPGTGQTNFVEIMMQNHAFPGPNCMAGYSVAAPNGLIAVGMWGYSNGDCTTADLLFTNGTPANLCCGVLGILDLTGGRVQLGGMPLAWATGGGGAGATVASDTGISRYAANIIAVGNGNNGDDSGTLRASGFISNGITGVDCLSGVTSGTVVVHKGIVTHC